MSPAGALASSGADMGRFMIAHLINGIRSLDPADGAADARERQPAHSRLCRHGARLLP